MAQDSNYDNPKVLLQFHRYLRKGQSRSGGWGLTTQGQRSWEASYKNRWSHDKVVRSTHGVNCTGSCSWNVYVKDGLITWETQAVDYPKIGEEIPQYEPRGCPRGASFSWYTYSPLRVRYPYIRASLIQAYRDAKATTPDPVQAWAQVVGDEEITKKYKSQRGHGGFVRSSVEETIEIIAAAHVYTTKNYGPDRIAGFSPLPAMSQVSFSAGVRFLSLLGGVILSFYDWYADLPPASPQVFGDQTDVPESSDWWNASYLIIWGTNIPITRTPDAHFMVEARYRGQKVVVVSPDYSDHTKFADDWLPARPGTDAALAMSMGHVILKEFYVDKQSPFFTDYVKQYTDLPFLITLTKRRDAYVPDRFLKASDLGQVSENNDWKTVVIDSKTQQPYVPNGSIGFRWGEEGKGSWNLKLGEVDPLLSFYDPKCDSVEIDLVNFDVTPGQSSGIVRRGVPVRKIGGQLTTTVFDLLLANYGVGRPGLVGNWSTDYQDESSPCTPAWQEPITGVKATDAIRIAREFAHNAEVSGGRSMIAMGAGTNHWYHSDQTYRSFLALLQLCGCQGKNGGGWAHYVGQEKVRPLTGLSTLAYANDWVKSVRHQTSTPFFYLASDQWRYEGFGPSILASPLGKGLFESQQFADCYAKAARMGWSPSNPFFSTNPLDITDQAQANGVSIQDWIVEKLKDKTLKQAATDPDNPANFPRVLTMWRANILGSSGKGQEFFLHHLLGTQASIRAKETPIQDRPQEVVWNEQAPSGKLDLVTTIDFRMTGTCLNSDIVLPAATWYEKHDLSSTDMHPFVHAFSPAIAPPWQSKTDWDWFSLLSEKFSELSKTHLGIRKDIVMAPLAHDSPDEISQPNGKVLDWALGQCEPIPGKTMPKFVIIERDYPNLAQKWKALGPLLEESGASPKGAHWDLNKEVQYLKAKNGIIKEGITKGRPSVETDKQACEAILALSGTTNGRLALEGFRSYDQRCGTNLSELGLSNSQSRISFADTQIQPRNVFTSPEWSGIESEERRYSPFTINVEYKKPWHTLTGRQHFYLDHEWMLEYGDALPTYRPPLALVQHFKDQDTIGDGAKELYVQYLTPHSKWSIHSEYQDNLYMLTLFRGGPVIWLNNDDADELDIADNDWMEAVNRNGVIACRAVVSHRIPRGVCLMYHAQDNHLQVPISELSHKRGGTDNALTRIMFKPTHLIGGYAQFSYAFNYYGPTGSQRDYVTIIRKRLSKVEF